MLLVPPSLDIKHAQGISWRGVEIADTGSKAESPPQAPMPAASPPPPLRCQKRLHIPYFQEFLFGEDAVISEQRSPEQRKRGRWGSEDFGCVWPGRLRFWGSGNP